MNSHLNEWQSQMYILKDAGKRKDRCMLLKLICQTYDSDVYIQNCLYMCSLALINFFLK